MSIRLPVVAFSLILTLASAGLAAPDVVRLEDFKKDLPKVAQKVLDIVEGENQSAVAVGHFSGPAQHDANFGPGIEDLLSQSLDGLRKGLVQKKADLSVQGSYAFIDDPNASGRVLVKLTLEVKNRQAERVKEFVAELRNNADIAKIFGVTVSLPPDGMKDERNREIKDRIDNPKVSISGSLIRAAADSKLAVEIRAKSETDSKDAAPRNPKVVDGQAFVDVKRGEVYEVVIHNGGDREVAVALTIDGLDAFTFSEVVDDKTKKLKYTHYIIAKGQTNSIVGWHFRDQPPGNYSSFLVTEYGKGASARAPSSSQGKTGVLTVSFSFSFPAGTARSGSETGFGPPRDVKVKAVQRQIDPPHEFVTVRYTR